MIGQILMHVKLVKFWWPNSVQCQFHASTIHSWLTNCVLPTGHDCSIRLWQLDSKQCVQEITAHRKKFDESIFDVAFHPSKPYIASAGADALAKVFVWRVARQCLETNPTQLLEGSVVVPGCSIPLWAEET